MSSGAQYAQRRITNWAEYNQALVHRGSLTLWFPEDIGEVWYHEGAKHGRGLHKTFSDTAIQTCLSVRLIFHLPLRQTEGFVNALFQLMGQPHRCPDYSLLSKRGGRLEVALPRLSSNEPLDLVIDSTGLKVYGEGEWKVRMHGHSQRRTWRKLHLGVDAATHEIVAVGLTTPQVGDETMLPDLLEQVDHRPIHSVSADGAYDTRECHEAIQQRQATALIPPRAGAVEWEANHPRSEAVRAIAQHGRAAWKRASGYHRRSLAETAMYRYKQVIGPRLRARVLPTQITEAFVAVGVLNRLRGVGMPVRA